MGIHRSTAHANVFGLAVWSGKYKACFNDAKTTADVEMVVRILMHHIDKSSERLFGARYQHTRSRRVLFMLLKGLSASWQLAMLACTSLALMKCRQCM